MIGLHLRSYLSEYFSQRTSAGSIIDVGAATGDFSFELRAIRPSSDLVLIEPDPVAVTRLHHRFVGDPAVKIFQCALADQVGFGVLNLYEEHTQNSLLLQQGQSITGSVETTISTLDVLLGSIAGLPPPELIKIDTQGRDLQVLLGALATVRHHRPLIQVEVIFADLYVDQCSPVSIFQLMASEGYYLADFMMQHVDLQGRLAYADWLFTPDAPVLAPAAFECRDPLMLAQQAIVFEKAAAERLELIHRLDNECRARQLIIDRLPQGRI